MYDHVTNVFFIVLQAVAIVGAIVIVTDLIVFTFYLIVKPESVHRWFRRHYQTLRVEVQSIHDRITNKNAVISALNWKGIAEVYREDAHYLAEKLMDRVYDERPTHHPNDEAGEVAMKLWNDETFNSVLDKPQIMPIDRVESDRGELVYKHWNIMPDVDRYRYYEYGDVIIPRVVEDPIEVER